MKKHFFEIDTRLVNDTLSVCILWHTANPLKIKLSLSQLYTCLIFSSLVLVRLPRKYIIYVDVTTHQLGRQSAQSVVTSIYYRLWHLGLLGREWIRKFNRIYSDFFCPMENILFCRSCIFFPLDSFTRPKQKHLMMFTVKWNSWRPAHNHHILFSHL